MNVQKYQVQIDADAVTTIREICSDILVKTSIGPCRGLWLGSDSQVTEV